MRASEPLKTPTGGPASSPAPTPTLVAVASSPTRQRMVHDNPFRPSDVAAAPAGARTSSCWRVGLRAAATALIALVTQTSPAEPPAAAGETLTATPRLLSCRWRVGGKPGDLALRNRAVTAVVSRETGELVDFWQNSPAPASEPQLGSTRRIDGLWLLGQVLKLGRHSIDVVADSVVAGPDSIAARTRVSAGAGVVELTTTYRLHPSLPQLSIESRVEHVSGGKVAHVSIGDRIRWGNVDYVVDGAGVRPNAFHGRAGWIGRHGAGGDLRVDTPPGSRMRIDFQRRFWGSAPEIRTAYAGSVLLAGATVVATRTLGYAAIPRPAPPPTPTGSLNVTVTDEHGRPLAAKLSLRGRDGTRDPDFGNDGGLDGANRFVWSGNGHFARTLPVGKYRLLATAGIERDAQSWDVTITANQTVSRSGTLPRVIDTPGVIAADLHLHQAPSVDSDLGLAERIVAVAAEGVELAVASDHYVLTDLGPTVAEMRRSAALATPVQTMIGTEVSPVGHIFGHFNVFPLQPDDFIEYENTNPRRLFAEIRALAPQAILQVNHPRLGDTGYWRHYRLDPQTRRVPHYLRDEFDPGYDAVEILNGSEADSLPKLRGLLADYMHVVGQGHRYTATGGSDSHKLFFIDPGTPRNLIRYAAEGDDARDVEADPTAVVEAIRGGHVVVTTGPVIDADISGVGPGGTARAQGGRVRLRVRVRAAPWIDVRSVEVLLGQKAQRVRVLPIPASREVVRFDQTIVLPVAGKTFVVVCASGRSRLPNVAARQVRPFAFTNPIWVEASP